MEVMSEGEKVKQIWGLFSESEIEEVLEIPEGFKNQSFYLRDAAGQEVVLKLFLDNFLSDEILETQTRIIEELGEAGVPVIKLKKGKNGEILQIWEEGGQRLQIVASEYVATASFREYKIGEEMLENIALALRKLHKNLARVKEAAALKSFEPEQLLEKMVSAETREKITEYFSGLKSEWAALFKGFEDEYQAAVVNLGGELNKLEDNVQLIHGDFHLANLNIQDNQVVTIFDFDELQWAPVEFEIGRALIHLDEGYFLTEELIERFLQTYYQKELAKQKYSAVLVFMQLGCLYRIYRWLTYYRFGGKPDRHFSFYQEKLAKYQQIWRLK